MHFRAATLALFLLAGLSSAAQPVIDGTVNVGEYTYTSGDWSMAWDDSYVYVAKINVPANNVIAAQFDTDPQSTPTAGTSANGNVTGPSDSCCGGITPYVPTLPFRGDARAMYGLATSSLAVRDGAGGWTAGDPADLTGATGTSTVELRLRWDGIPGLTGRPASFNWLGYQLAGPSTVTTTATTPPAIPTGSSSIQYFWSVANTTVVAPTNPFSVRHFNFRVTDQADSGTNTLRNGITMSNADADSAKRFVTFGLGGAGAINLSTALPSITRAVTIDGTTDSVMPVVNGASGFNGFHLQDVTGATVRGMSLQGFLFAVRIDDGSSNTVAANEIGTVTANFIGVLIDLCENCVVGGPADSDRNVINQHDTAINVTNAPGTVIQNNYLGVAANGTTAQPNITGIAFGASPGMIIGGATGEGNVISGNSGPAIAGDGDSAVTILGNRIGVQAGSDAALGNGGTGVSVDTNAIIGSLTAPNVIAHNGEGLDAGAGNLIRGNSIYDNSITVTGGQPAATVHRAAVHDSGMVIRLSVASSSVIVPTQSLQLDLYADDDGPKQYLATSPCYAGGALAQTNWAVSGDYEAGEQFAVMVTAYEDANCTNVGDGTSAPTTFTAVAKNTTTVTLQTPDTTPWNGQSVMLTATIADGYETTGTMAFLDNGTPIPGCEAKTVDNTQVQCLATFSTDGTHSIVAVYSGDNFNEGDSSDPLVLTVSTHVFTGTGNFTDAARWTENAVPGAFENFRIEGISTFDSGAPGHYYGSMAIAASGEMKWTTNHVVPLRVMNITGPGLVNMTGGGILEINGTWDPATLFTPGIGTVRFTGAGSVPDRDYYNLTIAGGTMTTGGAIEVFNNLTVNSGSTFTPSHAVTVHAGIINAGTLQFAQLLIPAAKTVTAFNSFSAAGINVTGTFIPAASAIITGSLTGTGTVYVTGIANPDSFASQYIGSKTLTNLTVHYEGPIAQSIDALDYANLTVNNGAGAAVQPGTARVFGTLSLQLGRITVLGELVVQNTSPAAVNYLNGWVAGPGFSRMIATGTNGYLFPVGTVAAAPITLTFHNVDATGKVPVLAYDPETFGDTGNASGIDPALDANVYWEAFFDDVDFDTLDVAATFGFLPDPGANPETFVLRAWYGEWIDTNATPSEFAISATGVPFSPGYIFMAGNQLVSQQYTQITAAPATAIADGTQVTVTVQAKDSAGFDMTTGGNTVTLSTNLGTLGAVTDNLNGTYTALLSSTTVGTATITGTLDSGAITDTATVVFTGPTTTTLGSTPNPSLAGQNVSFTATVTSPNAGTITGMVTFKDGGTILGSGNVSGGVATFSTSLLSAGSHSITAHYEGSGLFNPSTSAPLTQTVYAPFGAPPFLTATATGTTTIALTWAPVNGATSYRVYRAASVAGGFVMIAEVGTNAYTDTGRAANTTYLYKVSAVGGNESALSATEAATTVIFTDASLTGVRVKAVHITQLQTAANAMRAAGNLAPFTFSSIAPGGTIRLVHLTELRTALNQARAAIGLAALSYTDPSPVAGTTTIKAAHITELRAGTQ